MMDIPDRRPFSGPMAELPDFSDELDRGCQTAGLRVQRDTRTHIDRISPYLPGESYAGAGGNAVYHRTETALPDPEPVERRPVDRLLEILKRFDAS